MHFVADANRDTNTTLCVSPVISARGVMESTSIASDIKMFERHVDRAVRVEQFLSKTLNPSLKPETHQGEVHAEGGQRQGEVVAGEVVVQHGGHPHVLRIHALQSFHHLRKECHNRALNLNRNSKPGLANAHNQTYGRSTVGMATMRDFLPLVL